MTDHLVRHACAEYGAFLLCVGGGDAAKSARSFKGATQEKKAVKPTRLQGMVALCQEQ